MAKQKLDPERRETLRRELREALASGTRQSQILDSMSRKYGIALETVRYHLKRLDHTEKSAPTKKARRGRPRRVRKAAQTALKARHTAVPAGRPVRLLDVVSQLSERALRRALKAKKLIPQLEASIRRERRLAERQRAIRRALRAAKTRRRTLQNRISRLTFAR